MVEAVIWDFGGVFTTSPFEAFARYELEKGLPKDLIRKINSTNHEHNAWARFERSELDIEGFDAAFAEEARALGHHVPGRDVLPLLSGDFRPEMIEALRRIKTQFSTGCITNNMPSNAAGGTQAGRTLYAREIMELFDHVIEFVTHRHPQARPAHLSHDVRRASRRACCVRVPRRSRRESQARARHGHDDDQGRDGGQGDQGARGGDGDGVAVEGQRERTGPPSP